MILLVVGIGEWRSRAARQSSVWAKGVGTLSMLTLTQSDTIKHSNGIEDGITGAVNHHGAVVTTRMGGFAKWLVIGMTHHRQTLQTFKESCGCKERLNGMIYQGSSYCAPPFHAWDVSSLSLWFDWQFDPSWSCRVLPLSHLWAHFLLLSL